jgi:hypothetical protein
MGKVLKSKLIGLLEVSTFIGFISKEAIQNESSQISNLKPPCDTGLASFLEADS